MNPDVSECGVKLMRGSVYDYLPVFDFALDKSLVHSPSLTMHSCSTSNILVIFTPIFIYVHPSFSSAHSKLTAAWDRSNGSSGIYVTGQTNW